MTRLWARIGATFVVAVALFAPVRAFDRTGVDGKDRAAAQQVDTQKKYSGAPMDLDLQGADLRMVLRTFAETNGLNLVIDQAVKGTVDIKLTAVPWDQALDIILKDAKLGYVVDGTVVRIAPLTSLKDEEDNRRKLTDAQALSGTLEVRTYPLSYAQAGKMDALLKYAALSSRGEIRVDDRTNTLIVRDLPDRLAAVEALIKTLDRAEPQVEIEARIVETNRDAARELGVVWGVNAKATPQIGNTTSLAFPNNGQVNASTNTKVPTPNSQIGMTLGAINGALSLDVALSALESDGHGRVLATPKVTTQNNHEAEMTQGVQIPIQIVANNTVTVQFKDAALKLLVTPQITASNTVIMQVSLENATPDFTRSINNIPPIDTQRAVTTVQVADGATTVIGGIVLSREQAS
jgi:type IV pilus assembly protein PilQ